MTDTQQAVAIVDALDQALRGPLGVRRVDSVDEFVASGAFSRYLRNPRLTFALHFDIEPTFLILDPRLGTLGVVELVMAGTNSAEEVGTSVRRHVDRATYLRHLLLRDGKRAERRPLTVELVLLTADPVGEEKGTLDAIGGALRGVLQDTNSLFQVGVSVLSHGGPAGFNKRLRRAFPWLLTATRDWLKSPRANPEDAKNTAGATLRHVKLSNYRLSGVREINLSDARVHLVHGPNGSGKSSIAEALEIVTCGTIERLVRAGADRYDDVIRHSGSPDPATIQLGWIDGSDKQIRDDDPHTVVSDGVTQPLDGSVNVASFRLDQPLMDRLIGHSPHERAKIFMDAFFPGAVASRAKYEQASTAHQSALQKIDAVVERLVLARTSLADLENRQVSLSKVATDPFPAILNTWLEQTALMDLLQRQRVVRTTIEGAQREGWQALDDASAAVVSTLAGSSDVATLERFERQRKEAMDELQQQLAAFRATDVKADGAAPLVARSVIETLNAVDAFLFVDDVRTSYGRFGDKVGAVFHAGDTPTYGPIVIGSGKWAEPVLKDLDRLIDACRSLRVDDAAPQDWPGKAACSEYDGARSTHAARLAAGRELTLNFIDRLRPDDRAQGEFDGSLIAALNEVMALFTPARWAYADILLPPNLEGDKVGVAMHLDAGTEAIRAELRLNTAELNLFTVALFVLCVGCVRKPLNLVILDDPLQNMDELTATALARGLARIVRLWADLGRGEEVLILFHGYNDLERFSAEIGAATYRLPWLSPSAAPASLPPLRATELSSDVSAVQQIDGMMLAASQ